MKPLQELQKGLHVNIIPGRKLQVFNRIDSILRIQLQFSKTFFRPIIDSCGLEKKSKNTHQYGYIARANDYVASLG